MKQSNAITIHCAGCGSAISIETMAPSVTCSHCGNTQIVDPGLLRKLRSFEDAVDHELDHVSVARDHVEAWRQTTRSLQKGNMWKSVGLAFLLMGGMPGAVVLIGLYMMDRGIIDPENTQWLTYVPALASLGGIALFYVLWFLRNRKKGSRATLKATTVGCPDCGAANEMIPGELVEICQFCGAALVPTDTIMEQVVDAAREERRRATMEKYRAERSGYAMYQGVGMGSTGLILSIGGSFLLMIGGGTVVFGYQMIVGEEPYHPAIFGMAAASIAMIAGMVIAIRFKKARKVRYRLEVEGLAESFGGRVLEGIPGKVGWLNRFFAGPVEPLELFPGERYGVGEMKVDGYNLMFDVNPVALSDQHRPFVTIFLACAVPGSFSEAGVPSYTVSEEANAFIEEARGMEFDVVISDAGLVAHAYPEHAPFFKSPDNIATLGAPISLMARLARALDAAPNGEIP